MSKLPKLADIPRTSIDSLADADAAVEAVRRALVEMYRVMLDEDRRTTTASFWAKLGTGSAVGGATAQWTYTWTEVIKTATGYGGWATKPNGRSGLAARNAAEELDSGGTVAPDNLIVRMHAVRVVRGGQWEYWFEYTGAL